MKKLLILIIFILGFVIRIVGVSSYPTGFTQDEAGLGYDAYSILSTGKDQWGKAFPLALRSFGDYKLPGYSYLSIPFVAIFGLNEFSVRLLNVLAGSVALVFTYLMVSELSKNKTLALLASFLLAFSSWHISMSRGAFEANLSTLFLPLGVWGFLKGLKNSRFLWISLLAFSLNMFSYHSARVFTPLLLIALFYCYRNKFFTGNNFHESLAGFLKKYRLLAIASMFVTLVVLASFYAGAGKRGLDISIFNPTDKWGAVSDRRYEAVLQGVPDPIARMFSNKLTYVLKRFSKSYLSYLSLNFFFIDGPGEWTYGMIPGRGVLYLFELVTLLLAIGYFIKNKRFKGMGFIIVWVLLSPIPAALSKSIGSAANRVTVMVPAIQVLSAYGLLLLLRYISEFNKRLRYVSYALIIMVLAASLVGFLEDYFIHAPIHAAPSMHYGMRNLVNIVKNNEDNYSEIVISRSLSVPNIWVAFYETWDPSSYQEASKDWLRYESEGFLYVDQLGEYRLGKYTFGNVESGLSERQEKTLFVGKLEEFRAKHNIIDTIYYPNNEVAIVVAENVPE